MLFLRRIISPCRVQFIILEFYQTTGKLTLVSIAHEDDRLVISQTDLPGDAIPPQLYHQ